MNYTTDLYMLNNDHSSIKAIKEKELASNALISNQCTICGLVNFNSWGLTMHMRRHNNERPSKCTFCTASFVNNSELKSHMDTKHTKEKRHKCRFCPESFSSNSSRYFHEDKHGMMQHKCKYCEEKFKTKIQRRIHQKCHEKEELTCKYCPKKFANGEFLKVHEESDHGRAIMSLKCFKCELKFNTKEELNVHREIHKSMTPCSKRPQVNQKSNEVSYFQDSDIKLSSYFFTCGVCSKTFSFHIDLTKHIELNHPTEKDAIYKYKCNICNKSFDSQVKLRGHKIGHGPKKHKCNQCEYRTARAKDLERHVEARHSSQKSYTCSECGEAFTQYYNFVNHKLKHGEKNFKCSQCDKSYFVKSRLSKHLRSVHNSGKQVCDQCGRVYSNILSLKVHKNYMHKSPPLCLCNYCGKSILVNEIQLHQANCVKLTDNPISKKLKGPHCLECNITFSIPRYLLEHCKEYHPQRIYPCKSCQNEYLSLESSLKHYARVHASKKKSKKDKKSNVFTVEEKRSLRRVSQQKFINKRYECFACGITFVFDNELDNHLSMKLCQSPTAQTNNLKNTNWSVNYFKIIKINAHEEGGDVFEITVLPKFIFSGSLSKCNIEKFENNKMIGHSVKVEIKEEFSVPSFEETIHSTTSNDEIFIKPKKTSIKSGQPSTKFDIPIILDDLDRKDTKIHASETKSSNFLKKDSNHDINVENRISSSNIISLDINKEDVRSPQHLINLLQEKVVNVKGQSFLHLQDVLDHLKHFTDMQ